MKRILLILLCSAFLGATPTGDTPSEKTTYVYVCTGSSSVAYHTSTRCKGLTNCRASVKKVTLEEAIRMNRRPCKLCAE